MGRGQKKRRLGRVIAKKGKGEAWRMFRDRNGVEEKVEKSVAKGCRLVEVSGACC